VRQETQLEEPDRASISTIQSAIGRTVSDVHRIDWETGEAAQFSTPGANLRETFHPIIVQFSDGTRIRFYSEVSNTVRLTAELAEPQLPGLPDANAIGIRVAQVRFAVDQVSLLSNAWTLWSASFVSPDGRSLTLALGESTGHKSIALIPDSFLVFDNSADARR